MNIKLDDTKKSGELTGQHIWDAAKNWGGFEQIG